MTDATRDSSTGRLLPGHHMGRPPGKTLIERFRELVTPDWEAIVAKAVEQAKGGDERAREWLGNRYLPQPRSTPPRVAVPGMREALTLEAKAQCVVAAGADGLLSHEEVRAWLATLADAAKVLAFDDLASRIKALEEGRSTPRLSNTAAVDAEFVDANDVRDLV